ANAAGGAASLDSTWSALSALLGGRCPPTWSTSSRAGLPGGVILSHAAVPRGRLRGNARCRRTRLHRGPCERPRVDRLSTSHTRPSLTRPVVGPWDLPPPAPTCVEGGAGYFRDREVSLCTPSSTDSLAPTIPPFSANSPSLPGSRSPRWPRSCPI